jgi:4-amino-4-deoxy-L-arabinose transferase-like glycosyltransferase
MVVESEGATVGVAAETPKRNNSRWLVGATILWFAGIFLLLFGLAMRQYFNHDEHQFVASATLIAREGLLPYRDFPYFHTPTLSFLYALLFQRTDYLLLGARGVSVVASWLTMVLLMVAALSWLRVLRMGMRIGLAILLILLLVSTPSFLHASGAAWNHDVSILLLLAAAMLQTTWLTRSSRPHSWLFWIGLLLGGAAGVRSSYVLAFPVFALAVVTALGWRRRTAWVALLWLGSGALLGLAPVLYTFWLAPSEFIFGNLTYARLNATYYAIVGEETLPMTLGQKLLQTLRYMGLEIGNLLMVLLVVYALWRVRRQIGLRSSPELIFLLLLLLSLLAGAFAPSPLQPQYIYSLFPTLALLFLAALARDAHPQTSLWIVGVAAVVALVVAAPRHGEGIATVFTPEEWLPLKVHARGEYAAMLAKQSPILTLAPIYALEGKSSIDPALATGPFGWRVASHLEPSQRLRFGLKSADDLLTDPSDPLPHAIMTGLHNNDAALEEGLLKFTQEHGYAPMPLPDQGTLWLLPQATWSDTIALVTALFPTTALLPGESFVVTFHLQALRPIDENLSILVRVIGVDGEDLLRSEGWPWGRPTSTWQTGEIWPDGHQLTIPIDAAPGPYRVEIAFYHPDTLELLDHPVTAGYIVVGAQAPIGSVLPEPIAFAEGITLVDLALPTQIWSAGGQADVQVTWRAETQTRGRYTTFVHLVGADGLVAQYDQEPFGGFYPTSDWMKGAAVNDVFPLVLPDNLPSGEYNLLVGLYDPMTGQRLHYFDQGAPAGDAFPVATIQVR